MDIKTAKNLAKNCGLKNWQLVDYVRKLVNENMKYSNDIPFCFHKTAFHRKKGYCVQQALCVRDILKSVGIKSELVYCIKAKFKEKISGHTWCRVTLNGETRDICSCRGGDNGKIDFTPQTKVKRYSPIVMAAGYLGSIPVCFKRKREKVKN